MTLWTSTYNYVRSFAYTQRSIAKPFCSFTSTSNPSSIHLTQVPAPIPNTGHVRMPSFLIPRHVTAHRLAATALYRSLLHQCRRLAPIHGDELQNIVRNRFKQTQHVHSYRRLRLAFQAGYEAIDYLDAAVAGDEESARYLRELVGRAPGKVRKAAEPRPRQQRVTSTTNAPGQGALERELASRPRPLEELSGKRKVPVLYSANKITILRFTKPQPNSLSSYIENRI